MLILLPFYLKRNKMVEPTYEEQQYNWLQQEFLYCLESEDYKRCSEIKKEMETFSFHMGLNFNN